MFQFSIFRIQNDNIDGAVKKTYHLQNSDYYCIEKIVAEKLVYHLNSNDLLYQHQYGFLSKNRRSII